MKPALGLIVLLFGVLMVAASCQRPKAVAADTVKEPTVRLYVVSTAAGALEPCGCTKDQLGGVDHAAAFVRSQAKDAPHALVVGAGPMLFLNPKLEESRATQDLWKAEALATSLGDLGLAAWAPGANDWARGPAELERLAKLSRADVLAANLKGATGGAKATRLTMVNGYKVGIAGVSEPKGPLGTPDGVEITDPKAALEAAHAELAKQGAQVFVALVASERGRALRLAEQVSGCIRRWSSENRTTREKATTRPFHRRSWAIRSSFRRRITCKGSPSSTCSCAGASRSRTAPASRRSNGKRA